MGLNFRNRFGILRSAKPAARSRLGLPPATGQHRAAAAVYPVTAGVGRCRGTVTAAAALGALIGLLAVLTSYGHAQLAAAPAGPAETVFSPRRDRCRAEDIPDDPARAFRDSAGRVHLFASHYINFGAIGPDLNSVRRDCTVAYQGAGSDDPARFDDRTWLASFWTEDGKTVYALAHNEFQGYLRPALCPSRQSLECWYNSVTAAVSADSGMHFHQQDGGIVAAPAYRYKPETHPVGYFNPTNIIKSGNYYYTMIWAEGAGDQMQGMCLLRIDDLSRPRSWRAWDGIQFGVRLWSPYLVERKGATCTPVAPHSLKWHVWSLVRHPPSGKYLALMDGPSPGFFISKSTDLLNWSEPEPVMNVAPAVAGECGNRALQVYPSLLDPDSRSPSFTTVGDTAYLYFTEFHFHGCTLPPDRDLVRLPVRISVR